MAAAMPVHLFCDCGGRTVLSDYLDEMATINQDIELAPIRTVQDFLTESARFQVPPYKNLERWSNRILSNLVYYQTNYFILILAVFLIVGMMHPSEMLIGFGCVVVAFGVFGYATSQNTSAVEFKKSHPIVCLLVIVGAGYLLVSLLSSVIVFLYGIALPALLMLTHASMRLRSLKNKLAGKLEAAGLKKTPMGHIFTLLGIEMELVSFTRID